MSIGRKVLTSLFLFLLAASVYAPSLRGGFVWDDVEVIEKSLDTFTTRGMIGQLLPPPAESKMARYWRPVLYASYVVDGALWGRAPRGFHLTNVVLYGASVVALWAAFLLVLGALAPSTAPAGALLGAALFALHPMHVESVAWVSGRTDVLAGLFFFLALALHAKGRSASGAAGVAYVAGAALGFALSLLSKEAAVAFPLAVLFFEAAAGGLRRGRSVASLALYVGVTALYLYLRGRHYMNLPPAALEAASAGGAEPLTALQGFVKAALTLVAVYGFYLYKLVFPLTFNAFVVSIPESPVYVALSAASLAALAALTAAAVRRGDRVTPFGVWWMLAALGPSALVALYGIAATPVAERYLFIPSAGWALVVGYWLAAALERPAPRRAAAAVGVVVILVLFGWLTVAREAVWRSDLVLWRDTVERSPWHALPHVNLGYALRAEGRYEEAALEFLRALRPEVVDTDHGRAVTANNLAATYIDMGQYRKARLALTRAERYDPHYMRTYYHLGLLRYIEAETSAGPAREEALRAAARYLGRALELAPRYARAHLLLAKVYLAQGEVARAKKEAATALTLGLTDRLKEEAEEIGKLDDGGRKDHP